MTIVTAALTRREIEKAESYGVCEIVPKPFEVEALIAAVKRCTSADEGGTLGPALCASGPVILFLADLLRQRLM